MTRIIALTGMIALLLALGFSAPTWWPTGEDYRIAFAQGDSGRNPMREMMRRMMQGLVPPPGMVPARLPDSGDPGATLLVRYCEQCHDLPSPLYKTAAQWPGVVERMLGRMDMMGSGMMGRGMMGMGSIDVPSAAEVRTLRDYLRKHAMTEASADELAAGHAADRAVFGATCAQCHVLPSPAMHTPQEWPAVVARMEGNMQLMGRPGIAQDERAAIARFLQAASAAAK